MDSANLEIDEGTISRTKAKKDYLLTDGDLEGLLFDEVENPVRKNYRAMKVYQVKDIQQRAIEKWKSLDVIKEKKEKKEKLTLTQHAKKSQAISDELSHSEILEEMQEFMSGVQLPVIASCEDDEELHNFEVSTEKSITVIEDSTFDNLCQCPIIITYYDCLNREMPEGPSWFIKKSFPTLVKEVKKSPFNNRKKLGHYCWSLTEIKDKLLFAIFVTNKWVRKPQVKAIPPFEYSAYELGICRISKTLSELTLQNGDRKLCIGTYVPYRGDQKKVSDALSQLPFPVRLFIKCRKKTLDEV